MGTEDSGVSGGDGQAPTTPPDGQAPKTPAVSPQAGDSAGNDGGMSLADALDALRKLRANEAAVRKDREELEALRTARKAAEDAKLDDAAKAQKELAEERKQRADLQQRYTSLLIAREAEKLGFINGDIAAVAIAAQVELDRDGVPTNVPELLKELKRANPYMVAKPAEEHNAPAPPRPGTAPTNAPRSGQPSTPSVDWKQPPRLSDPATWGRKSGAQ